MNKESDAAWERSNSAPKEDPTWLEIEMREASATERLIRVETLVESFAERHQRGLDEAQESRHRTNNFLMTMNGQLSVLLEKIEQREEDHQKLLERMVPLEADLSRRKTTRAIVSLAVAGFFGVFTFMWQNGSSVMDSVRHFFGGGK